jgi:Metallopeptidase family M24
MLLIENNGPGGHYAELGRTCVLGSAPERLLEEHRFTLRAREHCLGLLRPGAPAAEVFAAYNAFMREHGRPEDSAGCTATATATISSSAPSSASTRRWRSRRA